MRLFIVSLAVIFCFISSGVFAQSAADTIHWNANYKLQWGDFQGETPNSIRAAETSSGLSYRFNFGYHNKDTLFTYSVDCYFLKKQSWSKPDVNEYILNHEQGHFNITEVYARKLNMALKAYRPHPATMSADLKDIYSSIRDEKNRIQAQYDEETNHSVNTAKQKEWDDKIAAWLEEYPAF